MSFPGTPSEHYPGERLTFTLNHLSRDYMLQFNADGSVARFAVLGSLNQRFEDTVFPSMEELHHSVRRATMDEAETTANYAIPPITDPDYVVWKSTLPTAEEYQDAARDHLTTRLQPNFDSETTSCQNCEGSGTNCDVCSNGQVPLYPTLEFVNQETGETKPVVMDGSHLLAFGEVPIRTLPIEGDYSPGPAAEIRTHLQISAVATDAMHDLDIDPGNAAVYSPEHNSVIGLEFKLPDFTLAKHHWSKRGGQLEADDTSNAPAIIAGMQPELANYCAMGDTTLIIRPLRPLDQAFDDLRTRVSAQGQTLGYKKLGVATGQSGPGFLAVDSEGVAREIASDFDVRMALENAWLHLEK